MKKNELKHNLKEEAIKLYETKEAEFPEPEQIREIERVVLLKVIDNKWMAHLDDMDALREGIGLQAYGQRDPVVEYKMQGYEMYESMMASIQEDTVRILFHIRAVSYTHLGKTISVSEAKPGDLLFYASGDYINHVALYIGGGQVIHASNPTTGI